MLLLLIVSCRKGESCSYAKETEVYKKLGIDNRANPYNGFDTLTFTSNLGDTAKLFGLGKIIYEVNVANPVNLGTECPQQYHFNTEDISLTFLGSNTSLYKIQIHGYFYHSANYGDITEQTEYILNSLGGYYINPFQYNGTININGIDYSCFYNNYFPKIYYNSQFGILGIDSLNGKNWRLNK